MIADVTVAADVARALAGGVDVLVNNTLSAIGDNLVTIDEETWRRDMDGTLTSAYLLLRAVLPGMIERRGGAIVKSPRSMPSATTATRPTVPPKRASSA